MTQDLDVGQLVRSTAGRDQGALYVVVGHQGTGTILVADGRRRPLERPKRKNPRHLNPIGSVSGILGAGRMTNERIRAAIEVAKDGHGGIQEPKGDGG